MRDPKFVRRGLALVFSILFLDIVGIAIIMPVMPAFLEELTGGRIDEAAMDGGWLLFVYAAMQFLFAPLIGNLSDRFGRRPVLLASVFTFAVDNMICALAGSYWILFVGRVLAGISGASGATCAAYIADISDDNNRARNFGFIGIAVGAGFVFGPVIGGLLGEFGPRVPFYGAAVIAFANFAVAWFLLPETLAAADRRTFRLSRANPFTALRRMREYPGIGALLAVMVLMTLARTVYGSAWSFVSAFRYGWSEGTIGLSLGVYGVVSAATMAFVLPAMVRRYGEWRTALVGIIFSVIALFGYAFAWQAWMVFAVVIATAPEAMTDAPLRSLAAAKVPASEQGELQGTITSLGSLTTIAGPLLFTQLFGYFTGPAAPVVFSGISYLVAAIIALAGLFGFIFYVARHGSAENRPIRA